MDATDIDGTVSDMGRDYLRLHLASNIGPIGLRELIRHFGSPGAVLGASRSELMRVRGVGPEKAESICRARGDDGFEHEIERARENGVRILCVEDTDYPAWLKRIPDPPTCLYVRGTIEKTDCVAIAIVGTRRCSHYGREQAIRFGRALGSAGFTVVSGLARGIDGDAHRGALAAGGRTLAVLGGGLCSIYPTEHESLADDIVEHGAVVSEYAMDVAPQPGYFPPRNRIIAGLSLGVLVIEAGKRSGAMITARLATEYNREVFAVPGRVDHPELTDGVHRLIRESQAKLVTRLEDILDEFNELGEIMRPDDASAADDAPDAASTELPAFARLNARERAIFDTVADGAADADAIATATQLHIGSVTSVLVSLQLKGLITCRPGGHVELRRRQAT